MALEAKDKFGFTLLHHTASQGLLDLSIFLLKNGADVNYINDH